VYSNSCVLTEYRAIKAYWGSRGIISAFLTSALDGGEWSASRRDRITPGKCLLVCIV